MSTDADVQAAEVPDHVKVAVKDREPAFDDETKARAKENVLNFLTKFEEQTGESLNYKGSEQDTKDQIADLIIETLDILDPLEALAFGQVTSTLAYGYMLQVSAAAAEADGIEVVEGTTAEGDDGDSD